MDLADELAEDSERFDHTDDAYAKNVKKASIEWASNLAQNLFYNSILALLKQHPLDSLDDDDKPFWSGTRKGSTAIAVWFWTRFLALVAAKVK